MLLGRIKTGIFFPFAEKQQGRDISHKLDILQKFHLQNEQERLKKKQLQLNTVLKLAQKKVPYYKDLFQKLDFNPDLILKDIKYLQELPFLTKEILMEEEDRLINQDFKKENLHLRKTGGSTGPAASSYYDQEALDWTSAANLFALSLTGRRPHQLEYWLRPTFSNDGWKEKLKHWVLHRHSTCTTSLSEKSLAHLWSEIREKKPYLVHGHPSTLYALSVFVEKEKLFDPNAFSVFESTGETLDEKKIQSIEKNLGCKVYNRFGNAEFGVVAHSTSSPNKLEVFEYLCHPESISLGNGLEEIVLTTTTNTAMPLIRYKTGDIGRVIKEDGKSFIVHITGRIHDMVQTSNDLVSTHLIQDVLEKIGSVHEFQIIEKKNGQRLVKIVGTGEKKLEIQQAINGLLGQTELEFTNFDGLILSGWRDKFKYVIKE